MLPCGRRTTCMTCVGQCPGLDLYYTDPAQQLISAGQDLDGPDRDLYDLSDRRGSSKEKLLN